VFSVKGFHNALIPELFNKMKTLLVVILTQTDPIEYPESLPSVILGSTKASYLDNIFTISLNQYHFWLHCEDFLKQLNYE
jgi:hypothetical protein